MATRAIVAALVALASAASVRSAAAQAWAPRAREGDVTFVTQTIDHLGRINGDVRNACCGSTNVAVVVDADYGLTDRWSFSAGLPYVFAKYRGADPPPTSWYPEPAGDACHCLHSSFQDVTFGAHYNLLRVRRSFSLTTSVATGIPSHAYQYAGEAVVGFGLKELSLSADAGQRLDFILPGLSIDGRYAYTIVEQVLDFSHNRSNVGLDAAYSFANRLATHVILSGQRTYGGLRFPDDVRPFPERYADFHRLLRDNYFQAGAGASYSFRDWEWSFSFLKTVTGNNTHDLHIYTLSASRSFRLNR
jgi:hypothetical protein